MKPRWIAPPSNYHNGAEVSDKRTLQALRDYFRFAGDTAIMSGFGLKALMLFSLILAAPFFRVFRQPAKIALTYL